MSLTTIETPVSLEVASLLEAQLNASDNLNALRKEALEQFRKLGLPIKHEEYKHTPLTRLLEKNFNFKTTNPEASLSDIKKYEIPQLDANIMVFVNGIFNSKLSNIQSINVSVQTLEDALNTKQDLVLKHLSKYADTNADAFTAWNTAAWISGTFIHVAKNKVVEKPIVVYHIHDTTNGQVISANRNLILLEEGSSVTVIEKFDSSGKANHFSTLVTEAVVSENAELNYYSIQNDEGNHFLYNLTQIQQTNSSRVNTFTFTLNGKAIRNNLHLSIDGERIESHMYGLYVLGNDTFADNHTVVDHKKPNSFSNELYKGVMDGSSKGVFNGKIFVRPNAQKTNAFQSNRNILLTDKATVNTKPQLEIWADDVKCSHGCTTGQLDEEAMFYLQTRGIAKDTARAMMLYAFVGEVLEKIQQPALKNYLDTIISERLHKNF